MITASLLTHIKNMVEMSFYIQKYTMCSEIPSRPGLKTIGKLVPKQCYFLLLLLLLSLLFVSCQHLCKWYHSSIPIYNYIRHKSTNINSNLELECNCCCYETCFLAFVSSFTRQVQCSPLCRPPHRYTFHTSLPWLHDMSE